MSGAHSHRFLSGATGGRYASAHGVPSGKTLPTLVNSLPSFDVRMSRPASVDTRMYVPSAFLSMEGSWTPVTSPVTGSGFGYRGPVGVASFCGPTLTRRKRWQSFLNQGYWPTLV